MQEKMDNCGKQLENLNGLFLRGKKSFESLRIICTNVALLKFGKESEGWRSWWPFPRSKRSWGQRLVSDWVQAGFRLVPAPPHPHRPTRNQGDGSENKGFYRKTVNSGGRFTINTSFQQNQSKIKCLHDLFLCNCGRRTFFLQTGSGQSQASIE